MTVLNCKVLSNHPIKRLIWEKLVRGNWLITFIWKCLVKILDPNWRVLRRVWGAFVLLYCKDLNYCADVLLMNIGLTTHNELQKNV